MLRSLPLALLPGLLFLLPADAQAACGVPAARAIYETPSVQVYAKQKKLVACHRATGRSMGVGTDLNDGVGTDESHTVLGVLGGRWIHMQLYATAAESADVRLDSLSDLRDDVSVTAPVLDEEGENDVVALPGALVTAGEDGVVARYTDGRHELLSAAPAGVLAAAGARLYWRDVTGVHTTVLTLPAADPALALPRARTIGRCKPRPGARLVARDASIVITRAGGATWACRKGRTRRVSASIDASILSDRMVAYARPGFSGVIDVATGKRRELVSTGGPVVASAWALLGSAADSLHSWTYGSQAPAMIATAPASELAIGETDAEPIAYWLDSTGVPQSAAIR